MGRSTSQIKANKTSALVSKMTVGLQVIEASLPSGLDAKRIASQR
jgi:hypothetical protein